ncbi:MAG: DUF2851 family protein [Flavobacterium sp.]|nr:MAG: DUF2851 family protein [Flavobacterium sp.]
MNFPEEFLHFIWQFRLYQHQNLRTTTGDLVEVLQQGSLNKHAGPDFSNAKLIISKTTWAGNIEVHLKSSDWFVHQHQYNEAYENVILHVVLEDDQPVYRKDGSLVPTVVLKGLFNEQLFDKYLAMVNSTNDFPCQQQIATVDQFIIDGFLTRVVVKRLTEKSDSVYEKLNYLKGDWDETFYHFMAKNFGFKVNALPMEMLAQSLPQSIFAKHKDQPFQIEALLFGQAGFLNQTFEDDYPKQLKQEYLFLQKKYSLKPIDVSLWKFMRMRPQNFPTLRLAQFAGLIVASNHLFSKILSTRDYRNSAVLFENLPVNSFWQTHYHFNKTANQVSTQLGKKSIDNLLINTLSLFLFAYGKAMKQENFVTRALHLLEHLTAEENAVIQQFVDAGVTVKSAFNSQAILQLKKCYCNEKKCLTCGIGIKLLKQ